MHSKGTVNLMIDRCISVLNYITCTIMVLITLIIFSAVVLRQFDFSFTSAYELTMLLFPWIVYPGAIILTKEDGHISISIIRKSFSKNVQKWMLVFTKLVMIFFSFLLAKASFELAFAVKNHLLPILRISKFWLYGSVAVSFSGIVLVLLFQIISIMMNKDYLTERRDHDANSNDR